MIVYTYGTEYPFYYGQQVLLLDLQMGKWRERQRERERREIGSAQ